jgi:hypothetical protein
MKHLPECVMSDVDDSRFTSGLVDECICDRLRVAAQRGRERGWQEAIYMSAIDADNDGHA